MITDVATVQRAHGVVAAAATDPGRVRDHNEDVFHLDLDNGTLLVVDGVGGQAGGDVAAALAAETIRRRLERKDAPPEVRVREAITLANNAIFSESMEVPDLAGMACVLTLGVIEGAQLTIGHVGDSRLYKLDAHGITKLTHDHSPIGELEDARQMSEADAMQHERRNEVYRDVGSVPRDPEAPDFIELVFTTFEADAAILICSDGLTDMVPALEINRLVRKHAGSPETAAAALIEAANEAGGKDNITVLIVEGRSFPTTPDGGVAFPPPPLKASLDKVPTLPLETDPDSASSAGTAHPPTQTAARRWQDAWRQLAGSRAVALLVGALIGLAVSIVVAGLPDTSLLFRRGANPLVVGGTTVGAFATIRDALAVARPGEVVQIEPGEYAETLDVPAGVEVRAAAPARTVLVAPAGASDWVAVTANEPGATVRGLRIVGTPRAPMSQAIAVGGTNVQVDDVTFEGEVGLGVDIRGAGAIVRSSRFDELSGVGVRVGPVDASVRQNVFRSGGDKAVAALQAVGGSALSLHGNVFVHFARAVESDSRSEDLIGRDNYVIAPTTR
jgi:serine/threonine protein phosphatase PrpC